MTTYTAGGNSTNNYSNPNNDVPITSNNPDTNYSGPPNPYVINGTITRDTYGDDLQVLLQMPGIPTTGSSIVVTNARLYYALSSGYGDSSGGTSTTLGIDITLCSLKKPYLLAGVTYDTQDGTVAWTTPGAYDTSDRDVTPLAATQTIQDNNTNNTDNAPSNFGINHMSWAGTGLNQWLQDVRNGVRANNGFVIGVTGTTTNNNMYVNLAVMRNGLTAPSSNASDGQRAFLQWDESTGGPVVTNYNAVQAESGTATDTSSEVEVGTNYAATRAEAGAAADAPSGVVASTALSASQTESGAASSGQTSSTAFTAAETEAGAASDTPAAASVKISQTTEAGAATDTSALVGAGAFTATELESGAALDTSSLTGSTFAAGQTEAGAALDTSAVQPFNAAIAEAGAATDSEALAAVARSAAIVEAGTANESTQGATGAAVAEAGAASDTQTLAAVARTASQTEAGAAVDSNGLIGAGAFTVFDPEAGAALDTSSVTSNVGAASVAEGGAATDAPSVSGAPKSVVETGNAVDMSAVGGAITGVNEFGNALDVESETTTTTASVAEAGAATDTNTTTLRMASVAEGGNATDTTILVAPVGSSATQVETGAAVDTSSTLSGPRLAVVNEVGAALDISSGLPHSSILLVEMLNAQDSSGNGAPASNAIVESANAQDTSTASALIFRVLAEQPQLLDTEDAVGTAPGVVYDFEVMDAEDVTFLYNTNIAATADAYTVVDVTTTNAVNSTQVGVVESGAAVDLPSANGTIGTTDVLTLLDSTSQALQVVSTVDFIGTPLIGYTPDTVTFTDLTVGIAPITSWLWTFGDGSSSSVQNPSYTYNSPGVYDVSLTVGAAGSSSFSRYVLTAGNNVTIGSIAANGPFGIDIPIGQTAPLVIPYHVNPQGGFYPVGGYNAATANPSGYSSQVDTCGVMAGVGDSPASYVWQEGLNAQLYTYHLPVGSTDNLGFSDLRYCVYGSLVVLGSAKVGNKILYAYIKGAGYLPGGALPNAISSALPDFVSAICTDGTNIYALGATTGDIYTLHADTLVFRMVILRPNFALNGANATIVVDNTTNVMYYLTSVGGPSNVHPGAIYSWDGSSWNLAFNAVP